MSYKYKLTFLITWDITTKPDFEINCLFSYLDQEGTYMGKEKTALTRKHCLVLNWVCASTPKTKHWSNKNSAKNLKRYITSVGLKAKYIFISSSTCYFAGFYEISINGRGTNIRNINFATNINSGFAVC